MFHNNPRWTARIHPPNTPKVCYRRQSQQEESCILKITHTQRAGLQRAAAGNAAGASKQDALQLLQQATARFRNDITAAACLNISTSVLQLLTPSAFHLRVTDLLTAPCLQVASFTLERHQKTGQKTSVQVMIGHNKKLQQQTKPFQASPHKSKIINGKKDFL